MKLPRMLVLFFALAISLFVSPFVVAFEDPQNLMPVLDQNLVGVTFAQAFQVDDRFEIERRSCATAGNCSMTMAHFQVLSGDQDSVQVGTYIGDRTEPSRLAKVTRQQWEAISGNMARNVIREIESYGAKITILSLREVGVAVRVNGVLTNQVGWELTYNQQASFGSAEKGILVLSKFFRGPGQLVKRTTFGSFTGETTIELKNCRWAK